MEQRLNFVTLAVRDLDATRRFYLDGLGWQASVDVPGEVLMIRAGEHVVLSLWDRTAFEAEVGPIAAGPGIPPVVLSHNLATPVAVDEVLAVAQAAGADLVQQGSRRDWGGYSGYFADPDGYRWEVAHNPGPIGLEVLA